ncbi:hypothetical protein KA001_03085 [Patescibacteria group bacterium]|nr:hypothetical protein [Patescibacteria group bacterium]
MENKLLVIIGHSGSGKTELGLKIAKEFGKNIISADSRQVYIGLEYCTNKLPMDEKFKRDGGFWNIEGIKYYGYDLIKESEVFSAFDFCKFANGILENEKENPPLIVGGTGMYVNALFHEGFLEKIPANWELRKQLETKPTIELLELLEKNGMVINSLNNSEKNNKQRLIRKLEILQGLPRIGVAPNRGSPKMGLPLKNALIVGLYNNNFKEKVKSWVENNFENLEIEVQKLILKYPNSPLFKGFIFSEMRDYINSKVDKETTKEKIYFEYLHYIKRQKTYFKKYFPKTIWFDNTQSAFEYVRENL